MNFSWTNLHPPLLALLLAVLVALAFWLLWARRGDARMSRARLRNQAARHAAIIESASDAVISVDGEQRIVLFNPAAERLLGCSQQQALGQPVARFIPAALRARHAAHVAALADGPGRTLAMGRGRELRALRADGVEVDVEGTVSVADEPGSGGRSRLYTVVLRDISARKAAAADLHRISERYRIVVEQSPDAIWLAKGGRLVLVNRACVALFGAVSAAALVGRGLDEFFTLPLDAALRDASGGPQLHEVGLRRVDGSLGQAELSLADVPDHGERALQGVMRNLGERRRAEAELRQTQTALLQAQRIARLGYARLDLAGGHWVLSPSLTELLGLAPGTRLPYQEGWQLVHPDDRAAVERHLTAELSGPGKAFDIEFRARRADNGELRWLHAVGLGESGSDGQLTQLFGTVQDITERKLASLALEHSREELRRLSAGLSDAREQERRHVARELHDELGQRLLALKLDLTALRAAPPAVDGAAAGERLQPLLLAVDEALKATRRIAADLRPAMLDDLGLWPALEWLAADWRRRSGMEITLEGGSTDDSLTDTAATTVYRIVQEALTNVLRHAQAQRVAIHLQRDESWLCVSVEDDGRGLAAGDTDKRDSSGLAGIRERARILGGAATIENRAGGGCRLEVRLPLDRVDSAPDALEEVN